MQVFETERLFVRWFETTDADDFFRFNSNPDVMRYIRPVKNQAQSDDFLAENLGLYKDGSILGRWFAGDKKTGRFIGCFSLLYLSGEADFHLGYALMPCEQGKGYAIELLTGGLHYFFQQTNHPIVFAITEPRNLASRKLLLKAGFMLKGTVVQQDTLLELYYFTRARYELSFPSHV